MFQFFINIYKMHYKSNLIKQTDLDLDHGYIMEEE